MKVIPLFCTAQPFLRITLIATSKMAAVLPASVKRTDKGRSCRAKAFIRNKNAANRLRVNMYLQSNKVFFPFVKFRTELVEHQPVER